VVALIEGVVYVLLVAEALVCNNVPPVSVVYQRNVPAEVLLALSATAPVPQRLPLVIVGAVAGEFAFTVAVTAVRGALSQLLLLVIVT
jgi:hypothetical protein